MVSLFITALCAYGAYWFFSKQLGKTLLKLDDARGYYLICALVITFITSGIAFYWGKSADFLTLGLSQTEYDSRLAAAVLLNMLTGLVALIWGIISLKEPERY